MGTQTLLLNGDLAIRRATVLRDNILEGLDANQCLVLDISEATDIDVSFLQMLIAANRTAVHECKSLRLLAGDASLLADRVERCGIDPVLLPTSA